LKVEKNKLGKPFRECFLFIDFDYGVDDIKSNIYWLYNLFTPTGELKGVSKEGLEFDGEKFEKVSHLIKHIEDNNLEQVLVNKVKDVWYQIEEKISGNNRKKKYE